MSKDSDGPYMVDIRDLIQIQNDKVKITIKEYLYRILARKSMAISELQLEESHSALCKGLGKNCGVLYIRMLARIIIMPG